MHDPNGVDATSSIQHFYDKLLRLKDLMNTETGKQMAIHRDAYLREFLEEFYAEISSCNAEKTMVFLDACYSGVGRGIIIRPKDTPIDGNMIVMTATSSTQRSMPYHDKSHGLFTYYLLKTLKDSQPGVSISDLFKEVSASVRMKSVLINNSEQTPELLNGTGISQGWESWTF